MLSLSELHEQLYEAVQNLFKYDRGTPEFTHWTPIAENLMWDIKALTGRR